MVHIGNSAEVLLTELLGHVLFPFEDIGLQLHKEGPEDPERVHPDPVHGPFQLPLFADGGHIELVDMQSQFGHFPIPSVRVLDMDDLIYSSHQAYRILNPSLRGQGCFSIDEAEFRLQPVQP